MLTSCTTGVVKTLQKLVEIMPDTVVVGFIKMHYFEKSSKTFERVLRQMILRSPKEQSLRTTAKRRESHGANLDKVRTQKLPFRENTLRTIFQENSEKLLLVWYGHCTEA